MNTNNNLDEKNLTIDTENKEMHPEPEVPVQESKVDTPQAEQVQEAVQTDKTDEVALEDKQEVTGISDLKLVEETDGSNVGSAQSDVEATVSEEADEQKEKEQEKIDYHLEDGEADEADDSGNEADESDEDSESDNITGSLLTVDEIVQKLRELLEAERPQRKDIDEYKNQFYRTLRNEIEGQKQAFLSTGGEEIDFVANESALFIEGKELLQKIREKRSAITAMEEAEKEKNVARKLAIIEQVKQLTQNQGQEDFNKVYQEFKSLQQEWNEIKMIPQARVNELWKSYQHYVEIFYDLVRINNEFREYDFKKNLESKTELCEAAERLDEESDVVSAVHLLQNLHQEWREIGPVSR